MSVPKTSTLRVPGAVLTYDVRPKQSSTEPVLLMIGSPMGAAGFGTLSTYFADRTVVTYDPRGAERSKRTDGASETAVEEHADDLRRLISAVSSMPVDIFASSGGAVNALALVAQGGDQVRTLVAHEPPAAQVLPDRDEVLAANQHIHETYHRDGFGPAMAHFIALVSYQGPVPADFAEHVASDPGMFGLPTEDDGSRDDPLLGQNLLSCTRHNHDFDALRAAPTRIVVGVGTDSAGEIAHRAGLAVAERLGTVPVVFPSNHGGFLGGEYGQTGDPEAFAATLREVLTAEDQTVTPGTPPGSPPAPG